MPARLHASGGRKPFGFRGPAVRLGVLTGVCLSLVFVAWLVVANRMPVLERFALERNLAAAAAIGFFGLTPVLRFRGRPGSLWASGAIAWGILSLTYRLLSFFFSGLPQRYSSFQIFMVGAVVYTILATICWIGGVVWRVRGSRAAPGSMTHSSASRSNHHMS
jgi:hypothetical protein